MDIIKEKIKDKVSFLSEDFNLKDRDIIENNFDKIVNEIREKIKELKDIDNLEIYREVIDNKIEWSMG